ncbi:unnamed protein product [Wuchereria bancrofti]|uniref:Uncharacterized protein n=1 Tax=Wuchereria bancrofti TaxID=6293 RepID=A0A3P7DKY0_WUCBA|nr:unnamed protein product [Wuchereria bancrofti]
MTLPTDKDPYDVFKGIKSVLLSSKQGLIPIGVRADTGPIGGNTSNNLYYFYNRIGNCQASHVAMEKRQDPAEIKARPEALRSKYRAISLHGFQAVGAAFAGLRLLYSPGKKDEKGCESMLKIAIVGLPNAGTGAKEAMLLHDEAKVKDVKEAALTYLLVKWRVKGFC